MYRGYRDVTQQITAAHCCSTEPRKVLPILKTDEPVCPDGKLSCGNGECIDKELFCNDKFDCKDESDENACSEYLVPLETRTKS